MKRRFTLVIALAFASLAAQRGAQAPVQADSALEARTTAVASQLRCPICQGESIQESPAELAKQMRDVVRDQLRAGKSPGEVKAYFVSKYGEWILLQPKATGFNFLLFALPWVVVLGGLAVIAMALRRWTRPQPLTPDGDQGSATFGG